MQSGCYHADDQGVGLKEEEKEEGGNKAQNASGQCIPKKKSPLTA